MVLLVKAGEADLAVQVERLKVIEREDWNSGSDFYTAPRPHGHWGPNHRTLGLSPGALHIDIVAGQIVCIEVLWGITGSIGGLLGKFAL